MTSKQESIRAFITTEEGKDMLLGRGGISRVARHCGVSRSFVSHIVNGKTRRTEGRPAARVMPAISSLAAERERLDLDLRGHIAGIAGTLWKLGELGAIEELQRRVLDLGERLVGRRAAPGRAPRHRAGPRSSPPPAPACSGRDASRGPAEALSVRPLGRARQVDTAPAPRAPLVGEDEEEPARPEPAPVDADEGSDLAYARPRTRGDCAEGLRPCPWVGCRHHLFLDLARNGFIRLNFPDRAVEDLAETCALDVAARGGASLREIARLMGVSLARVGQIDLHALAKLRKRLARLEQGEVAPIAKLALLPVLQRRGSKTARDDGQGQDAVPDLQPSPPLAPPAEAQDDQEQGSDVEGAASVPPLPVGFSLAERLLHRATRIREQPADGEPRDSSKQP